jgi:murein DD-endopeptidase MepM/ murein hydrolase activator NlpD
MVGPVWAADTKIATPTDLNVRIIGTASFQGKFTALIEDLNTQTDSFYKVGDPIYGHRITAISAEGVQLEKNGAESYLAFDTKAVANRAENNEPSREIAAVIAPESKLQSGDSTRNFYTDSATKSTTRWDLFTPKKEKEVKKPSLAGEAVQSAKAIASVVAGKFGMPVAKYKRMSSGFGYRKHPIGGGSKMHKGIDFSANRGTRILSSDSGVVKYSGWKGGYGYTVIVDHQNGYETLYAHCSKLIADVGDNVNRGDLIAEVGSTGASTGNHLHFEIQKNGVAIDPEQFLPNL